MGWIHSGLSMNEVVFKGFASQWKKDINGWVGVVYMHSLESILEGSANQKLQDQDTGVNL